ncbi:hypothetical protein E2C01_059011 [Portunus trituberculatus]|uniref:Uncharacterized protein n=1 Tax=Portunus trituberculatus TaxID=210409 RepID=A0A5B7H4X9_PORTR|nr:hypothetical protein [Portunus trituberculatus]
MKKVRLIVPVRSIFRLRYLKREGKQKGEACRLATRSSKRLQVPLEVLKERVPVSRNPPDDDDNASVHVILSTLLCLSV